MGPLIKKFKVLIIGNSLVGKSSILRRHVEGKFIEDGTSTIGVDYRAITYSRSEQRYDLHIWDTAGQDRFRNVTRAYYRDANAALLVFNLNDHTSFNAITEWYQELLDQTGKMVNEMVIILIGNKSDLEHRVTMSEITDMASKLKISTYIQTSAKNGDRIGEVFDQILEKLITIDEPIKTVDSVIRVGSRQTSRKITTKCCS